MKKRGMDSQETIEVILITLFHFYYYLGAPKVDLMKVEYQPEYEFQGYKINLMKDSSFLYLQKPIDVKKSQYGFHFQISEEQLQDINIGLNLVHPKLMIKTKSFYMRSPTVKIWDGLNSYFNEVTGEVRRVKIEIQGYKKKDRKLEPVWKLVEIVCN